MHDSATTVFMRCTVAVINGYNLGLKMVYKRTPTPLRTPDQNITLNVSPVAQTDIPHRQSHRTTHEVRGSFRLAQSNTQTHTYIRIHANTHTYTHTHVHVCMHVCSLHHMECILKQMVDMYIKAVYAVGACVTIKLS